MTTSPLTNPEIERIFGEGESAPLPASAPASLIEEWRRFVRFVRRPYLPPHAGSSAATLTGKVTGKVTAKVTGTFRMLWLDLPLMGMLIALLSLAAALGFELPENINATLEFSVWTVVLVVLVAPVLEEFAFRSWLNGAPAIMVLVALCALGLIGVPLALNVFDPGGQLPLLNLFAPLLVALGFVAAVIMRKRPVPGPFRSWFAVFFWGSALGFALIHLGNYSSLSWSMLAILLPLVLPQFALGAMLGYLRVHYGLMSAIALHAAHNAILFALASLGAGMSGEG